MIQLIIIENYLHRKDPKSWRSTSWESTKLIYRNLFYKQLFAWLRMSTSSQGSGSQSGRTVKPALPLAQRQIVKSCMDNAKDDIAERIYRRVIEKREDFRNFVESLPVVRLFLL